MSDEELIARLRKADEYEPLGHDGWEAADRIEALTEQLAAARDDAKEAETYAEELEKELNICRTYVPEQEHIAKISQQLLICSRTGIFEAKLTLMTTERDEAWKRAAHAEKMWGEAEVKLAKAVGALRFYAWENEMRLPSDGPWGAGSTDFGKVARTTLAEISSEAALNKGESHE